MSRASIDPDAFSKLKELAAWVFESTEMVEEQKDLLRCVDDNRHAKVAPLLKKLGFDQIKVTKHDMHPIWNVSKSFQGHGYKIWRITGKVPIKETRDYRSLFFPLSIGPGSESIASGEVQVAGQMLTPGTYIPITSSLALDGRLDCLIVLIPDSSETY